MSVELITYSMQSPNPSLTDGPVVTMRQIRKFDDEDPVNYLIRCCKALEDDDVKHDIALARDILSMILLGYQYLVAHHALHTEKLQTAIEELKASDTYKTIYNNLEAEDRLLLDFEATFVQRVQQM